MRAGVGVGIDVSVSYYPHRSISWMWLWVSMKGHMRRCAITMIILMDLGVLFSLGTM